MIRNQGVDSSLLNRIDQVAPGGPGRANVGKVTEGAPFQELLSEKLQASPTSGNAVLASSLKFSGHAVDRMKSRGISISPSDMARIEQAVQKAQSKGSRETLILMDRAALIVNVKNNTVVTAMDKQMMKENVFTNIDSTVVL